MCRIIHTKLFRTNGLLIVDVLGIWLETRPTLLNIKTLMVTLLLLEEVKVTSLVKMCDKKNKVLFTDTQCLVLSPEFKLPDENQVLLRIPRQNNMYSFNLENIVPSGGLACFIAKAIIDESNKWHRRLGHVNFKNLNKLVKGNLVRGLPSKIFQNDHTCVACQKGKQHKASNRGPTWLFDLDYLTDSMNYQPVRSENQANKHAGPQEANQNAGTKENIDAGDSPIEAESAQDYLCDCQFGFLTTSTVKCSKNVKITSIPDIKQDPQSVCVKTRSKVTKSFGAYAFVSYIQKQRRNNHNDFQHCLFACFLSQNEPKKISEALEDESWVDAMQEELLQFKIQKVWILVDLPYGKKAIGTKWVYRNKKDERGVVVRNKARMDVKSAFLYAKLHEGVYGVSTSRFLSHSLVSLEGSTMYVKDLYGLHQRSQSLSVLVLECPHLTWKPIQIVTMLEQNLDRKSTTGVRMINPEAALVKGRQYDLLYSLDKDGLEALLLPNLFILALTIVSIDSAKLIPLGKDSTAIETLKKISPRV
ncbi:putative ribonuclease H-like domain-containing protein [Tanacetum coccineum]